MREVLGFTLTELVIVVALIAIIAAIAIPNLLHSRLAANEATAISSLRNISKAEASYQAAYPTRGFAERLADLGGAPPCKPGPSSACLVDSVLTGGLKSGYSFVAAGTNRLANGIYTDYTAGAAPVVYNESGIRLFCVMSDAMVRFSPNPGRVTVPPDTGQCLSEAPLE